MRLFPSIAKRALRHSDSESIFHRFAEQVDASVEEFNRVQGSQILRCERTLNSVAVYRVLYPRVSMELEFDEAVGTIQMRRQSVEQSCSDRAGAVTTDLRLRVDLKNQVCLDRADYLRLARQALRPLIDAFV